MDYYRTAPVPVLQLCSTMAIVPVAPSVPNQVQDRLSAVGLVMQAKTLALKSCSANQRPVEVVQFWNQNYGSATSPHFTGTANFVCIMGTTRSLTK